MCHFVERKSKEEEPVSRGNRGRRWTHMERAEWFIVGGDIYMTSGRIGRVDKVRKKDLKKEKLREFITRNQ